MTEDKGFCLSDKMRIFKQGEEVWTDGTNEILLFDDVKEFIQRLKEKIKADKSKNLCCPLCAFRVELDEFLNEIAGSKLI